MNKRILIFGILFLLMFSVFIPITIGYNVKVSNIIEQSFRSFSRGKTLYVGGTEEGNYTKIQDAIDDAVDGDTVFVYDDSSPYIENLIVEKKRFLGRNGNMTFCLYRLNQLCLKDTGLIR